MKYCSKCGNTINPSDKFCGVCGNKLENAGDTPDSNANVEKNTTREPKKRPPLIIVIAALVTVVAIACVVIFATGAIEKLQYNSDIKNVSQEEENESAKTIVSIDSSEIKIVGADWDWDSSDGTTVDVILNVHNKSFNNIVRVDFSVEGVNGDSNISKFKAYGFVKKDSYGIMVASVSTDNYGVHPGVSSHEVVGAYENTELESYSVPKGKIVRNHGENNDYYDISLNNPNNVQVNQNSIIVLVLTNGKAVSESDATGAIDDDIPANKKNWRQNNAFYDPNLTKYRGNESKYKVYAIDVDYLLSR